MTEQTGSRAPGHSMVMKLLSGLQQGAEAPLTDGVAYSIGSADECDIVLQDESVAPQHLALTVEGGRIHLDALDRSVMVANRKLTPGQPLDLPPGSAIRLGVVYLGIGPAETDWTRIALPEMAESRPDIAAESVPAEGTVEASEEAQPAVPESEPDPKLTRLPVAVEPRPGSSRRRVALGIATVMALALIALWRPFSAWLNSDVAPTATVSEPSAVEKAKAVIADLGLADISVAARPGGVVVLTGYCATREIKNRVIAALQARGVAANNQLWPEDALQEAVTHTLERFGGKMLSHDYLQKGALRLSGRLRAGLRHDQLLATLRNDVPGLSRIESEVKTVADFITVLQERLRQAGLEEQVTLAAEGPGITATGVLDAERMERWKAIYRAFVAETGDVPALEGRLKLIHGSGQGTLPVAAASSVVADQPSAAPVQMAVRGVIIGPNQESYALLDNGMRVAEGDRIENRYLVEKIQFNRVVVRDGAQRKTYYIGDAAHE